MIQYLSNLCSEGRRSEVRLVISLARKQKSLRDLFFFFSCIMALIMLEIVYHSLIATRAGFHFLRNIQGSATRIKEST